MVKILLYLYLCFKIHDMLDLLMFSTWMNSNVIDTPHAPVLVLGQRIESFYCRFRRITKLFTFPNSSVGRIPVQGCVLP